jgi:hypothetical protein
MYRTPKGVRLGGRQKGTPNRVTTDARETFRLVFEKLAPEAEKWIRAAAKRNSAKGAELLLRLGEHFVPKLARHELVGPEKEPLRVSIRINRTVREGDESHLDTASPVAHPSSRAGGQPTRLRD